MHYERYNLLIDSSKRTNQAEPNTNFTVNLQSSYKIKTARLKIASIPLTSYNITALNNSFYASDNVGQFQIVIDVGFYSVNELLTQVNQQILSNGSFLVLSFSSSSGLFKLVESDNSSFIINLVLANPLLTYLGFPVSHNSSSPFYATSISQFIQADYLKLNINYLNTNQISIDNINSNSTFIIEKNTDFMTHSFGDMIFIQNTMEDSGSKNNVYADAINIQNFRVALCDKNNVALDLNNVDWYCIIELFVEKSHNTPINGF